MDFQRTETQYSSQAEERLVAAEAAWEEQRQRQNMPVEEARELLPYEIVLPGATIHMSHIEYLLICVLARRPYHAFTPRQIVLQVNAREQFVSEDNLRKHIRSLRDKLGFFHDYIQTVPYIGYRFKP